MNIFTKLAIEKTFTYSLWQRTIRTQKYNNNNNNNVQKVLLISSLSYSTRHHLSAAHRPYSVKERQSKIEISVIIALVLVASVSLA